MCAVVSRMEARLAALAVWLAASATLLAVASDRAAQQSPGGAPTAAAPSDAIVSRLPPEWRTVAAGMQITPDDEEDFLDESAADGLREEVAKRLVRHPSADAFMRAQLFADPAPRVRMAIAEAIVADARWAALPDTAALIDRVIVSDPDPVVSASVVEALHRRHTRRLRALLDDRMAADRAAGKTAAADRLIDQQDRLLLLERGTMLPSFLRVPGPPFTVAAADRPVRIVAFGDFGNGSEMQKAVARTIAASHASRPFDLGITVGDNFYSAGMESPSDARWQTQWEQLYGPLGITFYPTLGNHDWGLADSPAAEILYSRQSTTWRMPGAYYTFVAGPVQFFALDTQTIAASTRQRQWLDAELSRSQARWKVVYGHHPIYSGGGYRDRPDLIATLLPLLRHRVDVYLAGHDHNLQAIAPEDGVHFFVAGGGGAGLYALRPYERSLFSSRTHGFATVDADAVKLTVSLVDETGKTIYAATLTKEGDSASPVGFR